jgi:hypothetical protein
MGSTTQESTFWLTFKMSHGHSGRGSCQVRQIGPKLHFEEGHDSTRRDRCGRWLWRLVGLFLHVMRQLLKPIATLINTRIAIPDKKHAKRFIPAQIAAFGFSTRESRYAANPQATQANAIKTTQQPFRNSPARSAIQQSLINAADRAHVRRKSQITTVPVVA